MKKIKEIVMSLSLLGFISSSAFAVTTTDTHRLHHKLPRKHHVRHHRVYVEPTEPTVVEPVPPPAHIPGPNNLPTFGTQYLPIDINVPGQNFVTTGPYLGTKIQYSGSNLIINSPSVNEDVSILKLKHNIRQRLDELGIAGVDQYHLLLSGVIEGEAIYKHPGKGPARSDIALSTVGLDAYVVGNQPVSGLIELDYDDDPDDNTNFREHNSRVFVNKAFIVIGDFAKSPFYATIGQMYVPFGTYSSSMISSPLTKTLFRTKARAILVGFQQQAPNALYASAYAFKGDSYVGATSRVNNGGFNAGFKYNYRNYSGDIGGGVIANVADSGGMQFTQNKPLFDGFGGTGGFGNEQLVHQVPGADIHGLFSIGENWDFLAEYVSALRSFSTKDMTFNARGATPSALNAEASYSFPILDNKPSSVALGFGMTQQALAIGLPKQRYAAVFNTSLWRSTLESLEFRHDVNYAASNTSSGSLVPGPRGLGKPDNAVIAQFDIYF